MTHKWMSSYMAVFYSLTECSSLQIGIVPDVNSPWFQFGSVQFDSVQKQKIKDIIQ